MTKKSPKEPVADKKPATDKAPPETPDTPDMPETPDTSDTPEASETELEKAQRESEENRNLYLHAVAIWKTIATVLKKTWQTPCNPCWALFVWRFAMCATVWKRRWPPPRRTKQKLKKAWD